MTGRGGPRVTVTMGSRSLEAWQLVPARVADYQERHGVPSEPVV